MGSTDLTPEITPETLSSLLVNDNKVKVAGIDSDGVLRGKVMSKEKFLSIAESGFGFSSAVYGWDMQDMLYTTEARVSSPDAGGGYADLVAVPDLGSFRRISWEEDGMPLFLVRFVNGSQEVCADGRGMLKRITERLAGNGCVALAGAELEFLNFQTPSEDGYSQASQRYNVPAFLERNTPSALRPLGGMCAYSTMTPVANKKYFYDIFNTSAKFNCGIEGWHTESGPGVYEAALQVCGVDEMADRVSLFKFLAKSLGIDHGITPCFMAKPIQGLPGNSGHIHISLCDLTGHNLFAVDKLDPNPKWPDVAALSQTGQHFLAGLLDALPDIMPLLAPTINSYKRLVENYWAPVHLSWGLEDRMASIRVIAPPACKASATRFEVRIPGADMHPHYTLSALVAAGWRGVQKATPLRVPPMSARPKADPQLELLPKSLDAALERFKAEGSLAREILDNEFVDFFAATREHELRLWREAVTDWEFRRYVESV